MPRGLDPLERAHAHAALGVAGAREVVVDRAVNAEPTVEAVHPGTISAFANWVVVKRRRAGGRQRQRRAVAASSERVAAGLSAYGG